MKTIKALLKDFLYWRNVTEKPERKSDNIEPPNTNNNNTNNTKNTNTTNNSNNTNDETENLEMAGDNRMDCPDAPGTIENAEEAYQRGVIDGRNSRIEEMYFPKIEDGIPHFRGNPSKANPMGDIFSMAREA
ncbi:MAG: hypothetical protein J1E16_06400 [Muribaculaceae bacterium]|nr:hypothetical protein [Muribaculaceae bacterium]